jgi:hypothetical protein
MVPVRNRPYTAAKILGPTMYRCFLLLSLASLALCSCKEHGKSKAQAGAPANPPPPSAAHGLTAAARVGDYEVRTWFAENGDGRLQILEAGRLVYTQAGFRFYIGGCDSLASVAPGTDVTGDGLPDLVVGEWTGGAHCCFNASVFELGPQVKLLAVIEGRDEAPEFRDVNNDGIPEVRIEDWTYSHWPGSFAASPAPDVILRWQDGAYRVAADLMYEPAPSAAEIERRAAEIRASEDWDEPATGCGPGGGYSRWSIPRALFQEALDLMYSGHEQLGWEFVRAAWSPRFPVDEALLDELRQKRDSSPYWSSLATSDH